MNLTVLEPTGCAASFADFDLEPICVKTGRDEFFVATDLDGSIVGQHDREIQDNYLSRLEELGADERVTGLGVLSNAGEDRDSRANYLADQIAEAAGLDVARVTSFETGHAKPHPVMWQKLGEVAGVEVEDICYIGDQLPKDIWGGNFAGCGATVLLPPYRVNGEHPLTHYIQRPAEAVARAFLGLPFKAANIGQSEPTIEPEPATAAGYRRAKQIYALGAVGFAATGGYEIATAGNLAEVLTGLFGESMSAGFIGMAIMMRGHQASQELEERFQSVIRRNGGAERT